jgi:UDP-3-O-[3-hydroxymyristoyl] N-acetylglucosamine deacetylase
MVSKSPLKLTLIILFIKRLPSESIIDFSSTSFVKEVCRARTFGSWNEKELSCSQKI